MSVLGLYLKLEGGIDRRCGEITHEMSPINTDEGASRKQLVMKAGST